MKSIFRVIELITESCEHNGKLHEYLKIEETNFKDYYNPSNFFYFTREEAEKHAQSIRDYRSRDKFWAKEEIDGMTITREVVVEEIFPKKLY
jgi:hypothetical protein